MPRRSPCGDSSTAVVGYDASSPRPGGLKENGLAAQVPLYIYDAPDSGN